MMKMNFKVFGFLNKKELIIHWYLLKISQEKLK